MNSLRGKKMEQQGWSCYKEHLPIKIVEFCSRMCGKAGFVCFCSGTLKHNFSIKILKNIACF